MNQHLVSNVRSTYINAVSLCEILLGFCAENEAFYPVRYKFSKENSLNETK